LRFCCVERASDLRESDLVLAAGLALGLLGEEGGVDVGEDAARGNGHAVEELVELLVVADRELEVVRHDARLLAVASRVAGKLEDLSAEVLEHGGEVDRGAGADARAVLAGFQVAAPVVKTAVAASPAVGGWGAAPARCALADLSTRGITCPGAPLGLSLVGARDQRDAFPDGKRCILQRLETEARGRPTIQSGADRGTNRAIDAPFGRSRVSPETMLTHLNGATRSDLAEAVVEVRGRPRRLNKNEPGRKTTALTHRWGSHSSRPRR
jgi:hypothetical protein